MNRFTPIGTHVLPLVLLISVTYALMLNFSSTLTIWLDGFLTLPFYGLLLVALVALQFGRSRMVFSAVSLFCLWRFADALPLPFDQVLLLLATLHVWWLWRPDKGVSLYGLVFSALEYAMVLVTMWTVHNGIADHLVPALPILHSLHMSLGPTLSSAFTVAELLSYTLLLIPAFIRVVWVPSNAHLAMFSAFFFLVTHALPATQSIEPFIALVLAALYCAAVLVDSFNMAFRDELTGIPSRRALMQYVATLGRKYVVVMCDIDHFKSFNDTHGHDVGDQVLRLVASKLNQVTGGGRAFRYGGEEFTLVFARKDVHDVTPHVEVLRQIIADYPIVLRSKDRPSKRPKKSEKQAAKPAQKTVHVTCSFGVAAHEHHRQPFSDVMKAADEFLYDAKKAGRNCVKSGDKT